MSLWTATCHIQVETQRQRDLELVDESSCVLQQRKQMPTLFQSSEKRFNQMRNWEVGSGCHKRFYRHMLFCFIYRLLFETSGTASCGTTGIVYDYAFVCKMFRWLGFHVIIG